MSPTTVAISGFSSEAGKTTLLCELLRAFPEWEAIKITRGHYRSCGKDPHTCCVSDLLREEPLIRSGREETYAPGKDTGRYWDAGASNVHWLIVTDDQVEAGISVRLILCNIRVSRVPLLKYVDETSHEVTRQRADQASEASSAVLRYYRFENGLDEP